MHIKTKTYRFIILTLITFFILVACEKEINYIQSDRQYITENSANISLRGTYNNVELNDNYELLVTKDYIVYEDTYIVNYEVSPWDTVPAKHLNFSLFSQDFNNEMKFSITFNTETIRLSSISDFIKIYDNNKIIKVYAQFQNPFPSINLIKEFKIENFKCDERMGRIQFSMFVHYDHDSTKNYYGYGNVDIKYYKQEIYYN